MLRNCNITKKLRSQEGASLPLALLLFLICALLASIVVSAFTSSAGRMAELSGMDQRYYAATSSAGLLQDTFCGPEKSVTVTCVQTETRTVTTPYGSSTATPTDTKSVDSVVLKIDGKEVANGKGSVSLATANLTLRELAALRLMLGNENASATTSEIWEAALFNATGIPAATNYTLTHTVSTNSSGVSNDNVKNAASARVREELDKDGNLTFIVSAGENQKDLYSIQLKCGADLDRRTHVEENELTASNNDATSVRTEVTKVVTTRETIITWTAIEIAKAKDV